MIQSWRKGNWCRRFEVIFVLFRDRLQTSLLILNKSFFWGILQSADNYESLAAATIKPSGFLKFMLLSNMVSSQNHLIGNATLQPLRDQRNVFLAGFSLKGFWNQTFLYLPPIHQVNCFQTWLRKDFIILFFIFLKTFLCNSRVAVIEYPFIAWFPVLSDKPAPRIKAKIPRMLVRNYYARKLKWDHKIYWKLVSKM